MTPELNALNAKLQSLKLIVDEIDEQHPITLAMGLRREELLGRMTQIKREMQREINQRARLSPAMMKATLSNCTCGRKHGCVCDPNQRDADEPADRCDDCGRARLNCRCNPSEE